MIALPEDDSKPVFAWLPVAYHSGDITPGATRTSQVPTGSSFFSSDALGEKQTKAERLLVRGNTGSGQLFDPSVSLIHRDYFMDASPNQCVASLLGKDVAVNWRGPLFITAAVKNVQIDIDTTTFSIALSALRDFTSRMLNGPAWDADPTPPKKTKGVKFNSTAPFIEEVDVPLKHPAFKSGTPLPTMDMMRYPVKTYKYSAPSETPSNQSAPTSATAPFDATWLRLCLEPASPNFARPPASFLDDGASVIAVSAMKKPIDMRLLSLAVTYMKSVFGNVSDMDEQARVLFLQAADHEIAALAQLAQAVGMA